MKKIIVLIIVIMLSSVLIGCQESNDAVEENIEIEKSEEEQENEQIEVEKSEGTKSDEQNNPVYNPDIRNIKWGMSIEEVKKHEEAELGLEEENFLGYQNLEVAGFESFLYYNFNIDNQLFEAYYILIHDHTNETEYISDYEKIKELITDKYGEPTSDDVIWKDDLYKDDPSDWGMAIITGDLVYNTTWETDDLNILTWLEGDNFEQNFGVIYECKNISNEVPEKDDGL